MKKMWCVCLVISFTFVVFSHCYAVIIKWYKFPELVKKADLIVTGKIAIKNQQSILIVDNFIKGKARDEIIVKSISIGVIPPAYFREGECLLLFLAQPDSNNVAELVGASNQGKWPREKGNDGYPDILCDASVEDIQKIIIILLEMENVYNIQEKVELCIQYLNSNNHLLQLVTLQYVLEKSLWESNLESGIAYSDIIKKFIPNALILVDNDESSIRQESLSILKYAPRSVYIPIFIKKINDKDLVVRNVVKNVLRIFADDQEKLDYNPDTSVENLNIIQEKWQAWWENNKERFDNKK